VEGVTKTVSALSKHGVVLRHPAAFTVRVSLKALWDTALDAGGIPLVAECPFNNLGEEAFLDFHHYGYDQSAVTGHYTLTMLTKDRRCSKTPISRRSEPGNALANGLAEKNKHHLTMLRHWWDKDWFCVEWDAQKLAPLDFQETAWVLTCCLHERTVQKLKIEPRVPRSAIAKKLAARRGEIKQTAETMLYVPKREYGGGQGGTHASPRLHYRSPHWRQQPYGPRDKPSFREVFIEGMFINAENCTADERAEVRLSRHFKLALAEEHAF
jgi:hypothetical protein